MPGLARTLAAAAGLCLLALAGCSRRGLPPAAGRVTLDGTPLARATVSLLPQGAGQRPAAALTDDAGRFELRTGNLPGAAAGRYRVLIAKEVPADPAPNNDEPLPERGLISQASREELGRGMQPAARFPVRSVIPRRYADPLESPLVCDVPPGGTRDLHFELDAAP